MYRGICRVLCISFCAVIDMSGQKLFSARIAFCCLCITRLSVFMMRDTHLRLLLFADLLRDVDCCFWFFFHSSGMV